MFSGLFQPGGSSRGCGGELDWYKLQQIAYGPLGLTPDVFWSLTYAEFVMMCEGYQERVKVQRHRDAWMLANLLQPHCKERLRPESFLKEGSQGHGGWQKITPEEYERLMARKREG